MGKSRKDTNKRVLREDRVDPPILTSTRRTSRDPPRKWRGPRKSLFPLVLPLVPGRTHLLVSKVLRPPRVPLRELQLRLLLRLLLPLLLFLLLFLHHRSLPEEELGCGVVDPVEATERLYREERGSHRGAARPRSFGQLLRPHPLVWYVSPYAIEVQLLMVRPCPCGHAPPGRVPVHTALKIYPNQETVPATAPWPTAKTPRPSLKSHEAVNTPTKQARNEDKPAQWRWTWDAVSL